VAVISAGPVGLAAAAQLLARGETPIVLEAGDAVGFFFALFGAAKGCSTLVRPGFVADLYGTANSASIARLFCAVT
jgi:thioredoxin reductase